MASLVAAQGKGVKLEATVAKEVIADRGQEKVTQVEVGLPRNILLPQ